MFVSSNLVEDVGECSDSRAPGQAEQVVVKHPVISLDEVALLLACGK